MGELLLARRKPFARISNMRMNNSRVFMIRSVTIVFPEKERLKIFDILRIKLLMKEQESQVYRKPIAHGTVIRPLAVNCMIFMLTYVVRTVLRRLGRLQYGKCVEDFHGQLQFLSGCRITKKLKIY